MTTLMDMPEVRECTAEGCSYNHEHNCHAAAITIGGPSHAHCDTFIDVSVRGGLDLMVGHVGACHRSDCVHNTDLECGAPAIRVGPGQDLADCLTYQPR
ncbi:MAG TPA: DUF1540 domain-containing protein [Jiangellaceae bacterium]